MAGFVLFICIPTSVHEMNLIKLLSKRYKNEDVSDKSKEVIEEFVPLLNEDDCLNYNTIGDDTDIKSNKEKVATIELIILELLKTLEIDNYSWINKDEKYIQIMIPLKPCAKSEEIIEIFKENIIGRSANSVLSVIPCNLYYQSYSLKDNNIDVNADVGDINIKLSNREEAKNSAWGRFVSSVTTRLTVAQVVENLKSEAEVTFNFICLFVIATLLCAIGLVENSNVFLLSSMLISPMMGPVMAATFGTVIRDKTLLKMGVRGELIGLGIAVIVGFSYGSIICMSTDRYGANDWPTSEMISRGEVRTLGVGCLIALLSGAAIAVGILSQNVASLVGVAISTSLMPPAVNAGLLWSMSFVYYYKGNETSRYATLTYTEYYSFNRTTEITSLGVISLCLTFVNIICIYLAGILVFKIKEVAPIASRDKERRQFWKHGIKTARDYNKTLQNIKEHQQVDDKNGTFHMFNESFHSMHESTNYNTLNLRDYQFTWSPCMVLGKRLKKYGYHKTKKFDQKGLINYKSETIPDHTKLNQIFPNVCKPKPTTEITSERPKKGKQFKKFIVTATSSDSFKRSGDQ